MAIVAVTREVLPVLFPAPKALIILPEKLGSSPGVRVGRWGRGRGEYTRRTQRVPDPPVALRGAGVLKLGNTLTNLSDGRGEYTRREYPPVALRVQEQDIDVVRPRYGGLDPEKIRRPFCYPNDTKITKRR